MAAGEAGTRRPGHRPEYAGASQSRSIAASRLRTGRRSQTRTAGILLGTSTRREPSGLNVAHNTSDDSRAFDPSDHAAGFRLDQADDSVRVQERDQAAVRGEAEPRTAELTTKIPGSGRPELAWCTCRQQPFPVRAEGDSLAGNDEKARGLLGRHGAAPRGDGSGARIDGKVCHLASITDAPNLGAQVITTGCQPFPVRADSNVSAIVEWSDLRQVS